MSRSVMELLDEALQLPLSDRAELSHLIEASLTPETGTLHPAWRDEIARRSEEIKTGQVKGITWDEVRRRIKLIREGEVVSDG